MKEVKLIIIGFGVIGRGVAETLMEKRKYFKETGVNLKVSAICEINGSIVNSDGINLKKTLNLANNELDQHDDWQNTSTIDVLKSLDADIAIELTPGNIETGEPGLKHIKTALKNEKHVVTSNKAPLAIAFNELHALAKKNNLQLMYEAAVGGAIPIINLKSLLQADRILSIYGILNGTTNYILTKMTLEGVEFDVALKEAQELGYAESDPSYDINGFDTASKVVILANSLMNKSVSFKDVKVKGIEDITPDALELAKNHGYAIKLIGDVDRLDVSPRLVPANHPLNISGSLNAVMLHTDVAGDLTLIGRGAGAKETSSAVLSDVMSIAGAV